MFSLALSHFSLISHPKLHMSALWSYGRWLIVSGDMYIGVPICVLALERVCLRTFASVPG